MSGLSREILKWIQSLDLSYSVKNPKRDFSNGFLVAEIFSRYFRLDIQMHAYDNAISLQRKLANWELIERFFIKKQVPISREMIDACIHCREGAVQVLLETVYTCLTNRKIENVRPKNDDDLIPPFARSTAVQVLRAQLKDSELKSILTDNTQTRDRTAAILDEHRDTQRQEKAADPARFIPERKKASSPPVGRTASRPMPSGQDAPLGVVEFKEVQVRAIDPKTLAAVRASRREGMSISTLNLSSSSANASSPAGASRDAAATPGGGQQPDHSFMSRGGEELPPVVSTCDIVEGVVKVVLAGTAYLRNMQKSGGALSSLVFEYMIDKSKLGIDAGMAQTLCHALAEKEDDIFASCMQVPKEFWRLCNCAAPLLVRSDPKHASDTVRALFHAIGERIKAADAQYSAGLFNDYCLPKIAQTLRMQPSMRSALLELSNAYVVPEMRLQMFKELQSVVGDSSAFTMCLAVYVQFDPSVLEREDLLDIFLFYATQSLADSSVSIRVSGLDIMAAISKVTPHLVLPLVANFSALCEAWQTSISLLHVCGLLLEQTQPRTNHAAAVCDVVIAIVARYAKTPLVMKTVLQTLSGCVYEHEQLLEPFKLASVSLSARELHAVIQNDEPDCAAGVGVAGAVKGAQPCRSAVAAARAVSGLCKENLSSMSASILLCLVQEPFETDDLKDWKSVLDETKEALFTALAQRNICERAGVILNKIVTGLDALSIDALRLVPAAIKLIEAEGDLNGQKALMALLLQLQKQEDPYPQALEKIAAQCADSAHSFAAAWISKPTNFPTM